MKTPQEIARDICSAKGMVCLVPNENSMCGISSHEKTLCDCEVEELIAQAIKTERERAEGLKRALNKIDRDDDWNNVGDCIEIARQALKEYEGESV